MAANHTRHHFAEPSYQHHAVQLGITAATNGRPIYYSCWCKKRRPRDWFEWHWETAVSRTKYSERHSTIVL